MYFTYIIKSFKFKRLYIGYSNKLKERVNEHNKGMVQSTRPYRPWRLVYCECYISKSEAIKREQNLKLRANAWNQLKRRIRKSIEFDPD